MWQENATPKTLVLAAVIAGDGARLQQLLAEAGELGSTKANEKDEDGWPLLVLAAHSGNEDVVRTLLAHGADPNATEPTGGESALSMASMRGSMAVFRLLLDAGADPMRRLAQACFNGQDRPVEVTSLLRTAETGTPEMMELMLSRGSLPSSDQLDYLKSEVTPHVMDLMYAAVSNAELLRIGESQS